MQSTRYCIALDLNEGSSRAVMRLRQNETKRQLVINLNQSGRPYFIDEDCRAVVAGTRPDGFEFFNAAQIRDGRAFYEVTELNSSAVGTAKANLLLYGPDGELIASPAFSFEISAPAMGEGEILESAEATALTELIREADEAIDTMKASTITGAEVSVSNSVGEPSASVELIPSEDGQTLKLDFSNLKGDKGETGPVGPTGPKGDTGEPGAQGIQGIQGVRGEKGETGAKGDKGDKGDTGPQGDVGPAGKDGADGAPGAPGKDGVDGAPGAPGADGFSPTIDVSKSGDTTTLTITDKNGTKTAEIKDGSGADFSDEAAVEALIEVDMLPTITTASGAILTDINETVILRY